MPPKKYKKVTPANTRTILRQTCFLSLGIALTSVAFNATAVSAPVLSVAISNDSQAKVASFSATENPDADGYNLYSDGNYLNTFNTQSFDVPAREGRYCVVAFERNPGGSVDYSVCSNTVDVSGADVAAGTPVPDSNAVEVNTQRNQEDVLPAGLRAQIFSRSALELYWNRSPGETTYTVLRDGRELGTTTGTSFWSAGLVQGTTYEYVVRAGASQAVATLQVTTNNPGQLVVAEESASSSNTASSSTATPAATTTTTTNVTPPVQSAAAIAADASALSSTASALRLEFYSARVAELFWTHSPDIAQLDGYRVFVNGERVGFTAGTSFFFSRINPDPLPIIEVVAVDGQGNVGPPVRLGGLPDDSRSVDQVVEQPINEQPVVEESLEQTVEQSNSQSLNIFSVDNQPELLEGNQSPVIVPVSLARSSDGNPDQALTLTVQALDDLPGSPMRLELAQNRLAGNAQRLQTELRVWLPVGRRPLDFQQRRIRFGALADNGEQLDVSYDVSFNIAPVRAPDIYLLAGQSNMVGFSELGAKQPWPGGEDEPVDRIRQLNVTSNNRSFYSNFNDYSADDVIAGSPRLIRAEDPLHELLYPSRSSKGGTFVGPGLSFAKGLLDETTQQIILVPAAWSGTGFCRNEIDFRGWNATGGPGDAFDSVFGGSELSDRAVARLNLALSESGGIFRGIIWHQGEADSNSDACAANYAANLRQLVERLRSEPRVDLRGVGARNANADIPFVVATMSRGNDERGAFSVFSNTKRQVDSVHRQIASVIPHSGFVNTDDLVPTAYPCGTSSCVHFGAAAYREMGRRYAEVMMQLWGN